MPNLTVLILGGTTEGRTLAAALPGLILGGTTEGRTPAAALPGLTVISSLAGRTTAPLLPPGEVRIGGFGGAEGLAAFVRERGVDVLIDATHPFAAQISANAANAATATGVPLLALRRPGWTERDGDDWHRVPDLASAAALAPQLGTRIFLTTGRQDIAAFAAADDRWFLARSVEPPDPPRPRHLEVVLDRGPFTLDGERALLRTHRIDVLVSKDSGGPDAKLTAAREARIPVVLIDRPPTPPAATTVSTVAEAATWLTEKAQAIGP
jgi:precorrin-6A/cobalt-precorrin-6A reductase